MSPYLNDFSQVENFIMDTVSKQEVFVKKIISILFLKKSIALIKL